MATLLINTWVFVSALIFLYFSRMAANFRRQIPSLRDVALKERASWPSVSVIVPACNEEDTIAAALKSLLAIDYPALEIILVNDRSTDRTGAIMEELASRDPRVRVRHVTSLPEGWLGKPHALHLGVREASGDFLLFTDADVVFEPRTLLRAITAMENENIDMMAGLPQFISSSWPLTLVVAYFVHTTAITVSPKKLADSNHGQAVGIGAFNLVRRSMFQKTPGMEWLRGEVIEDLAMGFMVKKYGGKVSLWNGTDQLKIEWYPSLNALVRGFEKNNFAAVEYSIPILCGYLLTLYTPWLGMTVIPFFASSRLWPLVGVAWACYFFSNMRLLASQRHQPWLVFFFPMTIPLFPLILLRSAILCLKRGGIIWRGTFYELSFLRAHQRFKLRNLYKKKFANV